MVVTRHSSAGCLLLQAVLSLAWLDLAWGRALRLMPLGDSITQWVCGPIGHNPNAPQDVAGFGGYRQPLGQQLRQAGISFDMVGFQYDCGSHAGISGHTCEEIANEIEANAAAHSPDVVMLMCGTNDLYFRNSTLDPQRGANVSGVLERISTILDRLWAALPKATVLISTVTQINATMCQNYPPGPCPTDMPANIDALNGHLPALVKRFADQGHQVALHDVNAECQWRTGDYYTHGIHFSSAGFQKMANSWFKAVSNAMRWWHADL